jgi:hypothetical protein
MTFGILEIIYEIFFNDNYEHIALKCMQLIDKLFSNKFLITS